MDKELNEKINQIDLACRICGLNLQKKHLEVLIKCYELVESHDEATISEAVRILNSVESKYEKK